MHIYTHCCLLVCLQLSEMIEPSLMALAIRYKIKKKICRKFISPIIGVMPQITPKVQNVEKKNVVIRKI